MSATKALMINTQTPPTTPPLRTAAVEFPVTPSDAFSGKMSVVFESRDYLAGGSYPPIDDHPTPDPDRFSETDPVTGLEAVANFTAPQYVDGTVDLGGPPLSKENSPIVTTPSRLKAIPKPDREVTKNMDGKYVCSWPGCTEEIRECGRKCEWK